MPSINLWQHIKNPESFRYELNPRCSCFPESYLVELANNKANLVIQTALCRYSNERARINYREHPLTSKEYAEWKN